MHAYNNQSQFGESQKSGKLKGEEKHDEERKYFKRKLRIRFLILDSWLFWDIFISFLFKKFKFMYRITHVELERKEKTRHFHVRFS
jgi:hypothetical protein